LIYLISNYDLFNEFKISSLDEMESKLNNIAPSLCEYHFENIILYSQIHSYLNRNQIEKDFIFGNFRLLLDYEKNIFLEKDEAYNDDELTETSSLW